jgi:hypothetical protein
MNRFLSSVGAADWLEFMGRVLSTPRRRSIQRMAGVTATPCSDVFTRYFSLACFKRVPAET